MYLLIWDIFHIVEDTMPKQRVFCKKTLYQFVESVKLRLYRILDILRHNKALTESRERNG